MVYLNTAQKSIQKVYKISSCILLYTFVYFCNMAQKNYTKSIPKILLVYFWYTFVREKGAFFFARIAPSQRVPASKRTSSLPFSLNKGTAPREFKLRAKFWNYVVGKKGCAERIAPIGTLSQNGYGEYSGMYFSTYPMTNTNAKKRNTRAH